MVRRQRSKWSNGERNRIEAPFAPFPCEMIESAAFRSLSGSALRIMFQLTTVWSRSGGISSNANGKLIATYEQFSRFWGMDPHTVAAALRELKALGFVEVTEHGCAGNARSTSAESIPSDVPARRGHARHRYLRMEADRAGGCETHRQGGAALARRRPRRVRRPPPAVTNVTDKFRIPVGGL